MRAVIIVAWVVSVAPIVLGCRQDSRPNPSDTVVTTAASRTDRIAPVPAMGASAGTTSEPLVCTPNRFARGDTVMLRMKVPHGDYLVVTHPNGTVYFVVYPPFDRPAQSYSLMPSSDFRTAQLLKLPWTFAPYLGSTGATLFAKPSSTGAAATSFEWAKTSKVIRVVCRSNVN